MGRIRTVKPEFNSSESLSSVSCQAHLLAEALLCYADDEGYFNANPELVRAGTCPLRKDFKDITNLLNELVKIDYIRLGATNDGKRWGHVVNFKAHQVISHKKVSKISNKEIVWERSGKPLEASGNPPEEARTIPGDFHQEQGTGNRERNREQGRDSAPAPNAGDGSPLSAVRQVFEYYLEKTGRNKSLYGFTDQRRKKGMARMEEAMKKAHGDLAGASELMRIAVDAIADSKFHMGDNDRGEKYCDWERHLFGSAEKFDRWLTRVEETQ